MLTLLFTRTGIATIGRRNLQAYGREAIYESALLWWTRYLPLHYMQTAYLRYGFKHRDNRTNALKAAREPWPFGEHNELPAIGEELPHVFTGRSRERVLSAPSIEARAPNFETFVATVSIDAPAYNFSSGKRIDLRNEITRYTPMEASAMQKVFAKGFNGRIVRHHGRKHVKLSAA
jgi:hypothetical protein